MNRHETINKVIKGFAWEGGTKLLIQLVTWVTTILVARILSPNDYGIVAISGLFVGVLAIVTDMGFMAALINQEEVSRDEMDSTFWFSILISMLLFLLLYACAPLIARAYGLPVLTDIIRVSAIMLPLTSLKIVPVAIAMRELNYRYRAVTEMTGQFVTAMSSVTLAYNGFGAWTLVYSVLIGQSVVVIAYLPLLHHLPSFNPDYRKIRKIVAYGSHLMVSQIMEFFTLKSDVFIISIFLPHRLVGYYSMGLQLATIPLDKIGAVFNRVGFPAISRVKGNAGEARGMFLYMHRYLLVMTYPVLTGFALVARDLVTLVLTDKWLPIVPILQALCVINLLRVSGMIMPYVLAGVGNSYGVLKYQTVSSILLPLAFVVGVQFGMNGVLAGWFVAYPLVYLLVISMIARQFGMSYSEYLDTFRAPVLCAAVMVLAVYLFRHLVLTGTSMPGLVAEIGLGAVVYLSTYYLLFREEWLQISRRVRLMRNQAGQGGTEISDQRAG